MDKVGKYAFMAEPFHCDFSGRLFMGHLGNHMLNAADFHSSDRGFGMKYLMTIQRSWWRMPCAFSLPVTLPLWEKMATPMAMDGLYGR